MVKAKSKRAKKPRTRKVRKVIMKQGPDNAGSRYMKLLTNPCTGPLVHGPGSTDGGQVARFESDFLIGTGAGITGGALLWTPGAYSTGVTVAAGGNGLLTVSGINDTVTVLPVAATTELPGYSFLQSNASSYRCLAACAQVYWPGSEVNRQGFVSGAQTTRGLWLTSGNPISIGGLRAVSPIVERMPNDMFEIKWAPNYADGIFRAPLSQAQPEDSHASLLVTYAGVPAATGVRIRLVIVVEWKPNYSTQTVLSSNTDTGSSSAMSIQAIRKTLDSTDANWWNNLGDTMGRLAVAGVALGGGVYNSVRKGAYALTGGQPRITHSEL